MGVVLLGGFTNSVDILQDHGLGPGTCYAEASDGNRNRNDGTYSAGHHPRAFVHGAALSNLCKYNTTAMSARPLNIFVAISTVFIGEPYRG